MGSGQNKKKFGSFTAAIILSAGLLTYSCVRNGETDQGWSLTETILSRIAEPEFRDADYTITDFGAIPGGILCTHAIQAAIDSCSAAGGGRVIIPAGDFFTGAIHLRSNVNLHLDMKARLHFSTRPDDYLPVVRTRWEGIDCYNYSPLIYANNCENIAVTGEGTLDGQADNTHWWPWKGLPGFGWKENRNSQQDPAGRPRLQQFEKDQIPVSDRIMGPGSFLRPQFINFYRCRNILIEGITIKRAPFWLIHPLLSTNVIVRNVKTDSHGPNNDGCDPESCTDVLIEDCFFNTGDDCIAIKSGRNNDGRRAGIPSQNIIIRDCNMKNGHGGVVIGSEVSGGVRNIFAGNCTMDSPELQRAIRIKTNSNRGGMIRDIYIRDLDIGQVREAVLKINCLYDITREGTGPYIPRIRNVRLSNILSEKSKYPLYIQGIPGEQSIDSVFVWNSEFNGVEKKSFIQNASNVQLENVRINMDGR